MMRFKKYIRAPVVDYGAGNGDLTRFLLERYFTAAIEVRNLDVLRSSLACDNFLGAFTPAEAIKQVTARTIFLVEVVEHLRDDELRECLASCRDLLAPGGHLIVTTPNNEDLSTNSARRWGHVRSWTEFELRRTLCGAGFLMAESGTTHFSRSPYARQHASLPRRVASIIKHNLLRTNPNLFAVATTQ